MGAQLRLIFGRDDAWNESTALIALRRDPLVRHAGINPDRILKLLSFSRAEMNAIRRHEGLEEL
jgi:hypothetical protein